MTDGQTANGSFDLHAKIRNKLKRQKCWAANNFQVEGYRAWWAAFLLNVLVIGMQDCFLYGTSKLCDHHGSSFWETPIDESRNTCKCDDVQSLRHSTDFSQVLSQSTLHWIKYLIRSQLISLCSDLLHASPGIAYVVMHVCLTLVGIAQIGTNSGPK